MSGFNRNCAFNVVDITREKVIGGLTVPPHLFKEASTLGGDTSIDPRFLPHIGHQLLKANVRVLTGNQELGVIFADYVDEKEYRPLKQNGWPTFYVLNNCRAHFQILVPQNNDTPVNRLFRRYARKKEDLQRAGNKGLDSPPQCREHAKDEATLLRHLEMATQASLQDEMIYAPLITLQFLNGGRGGWLQDYVAWVKSL